VQAHPKRHCGTFSIEAKNPNDTPASQMNQPASDPSLKTSGPGSGAARRAPPGRWVPPALAALFVFGMVAARWDARTGFTSLLSFGGPKFEQRLPVLRDLPIAVGNDTGYDGQFGAQLAVAPDPRTPEIRAALDNPAYRARRIFLSWTAYVIGGSKPWRVLQVYALQNLAIWAGLAWLVWRQLRPTSDLRAVAIWACCMLTVGTLDCVRLSLSDLFAVLMLALAVWAVAKGRPWTAAGALAVAGLTREASLLGGTVLWPAHAAGKRERLLAAARVACAAAPLLAWMAWLACTVSRNGTFGRNNIDWPFAAFIRHCSECATHLARGDLDSRQSFGLIGALGLAGQSLHLLLKPRFSEPWWRIGAGFALLFWFLGDEVWKGYWAAARALLPMTFAFNILAPDDRRFWARMTIANAGLVLHGIWRMLP
jgi:hypothetical protein